MGIGDWGLGIGDWAQSPIPICFFNIKWNIKNKMLNENFLKKNIYLKLSNINSNTDK